MNTKRAFRVAIALIVAATVSFVGVQSASAVSGSITGFTTPVNLTFEGGTTASAALITLRTVAADELLTYCIDLNTHTNTGVTYDEGSWTQANVPDVDKVTAILQASYPVRSLVQLQQSSGIATLTVDDAVAGTQAAIWHFTDLVNLDRTIDAQNATSNIGGLYDYLLGVAANPVAEPVPALSITPSNTSGTVATMVGPFTLNVTPANSTVVVTNDAGVGFTDAAGNPMVPSANGDQFWITPTTEGSFTINAAADIAVPTGRVFLHAITATDPDAHQKLVLAKSDAVTTTATVSFESTPVPTTTTEAPTTTTEAAVTTAANTTTTLAAAAVTTEAPTTTQIPIVAALAPVPTQPSVAVARVNAVLPATGSSSTLPGLLVAAGILFLGIILTAATRRRTAP